MKLKDKYIKLIVFAISQNLKNLFSDIFFTKEKVGWRWWECLGFAPRSNSFAIEPSVQVCSIFSLSGLAISLRRPSANPPNPLKSIQLLTHTKPIKKPALKAGFFIGGDGGSRTHVHCG